MTNNYIIPVLHFIKYNAIGIINTLITLAVVWVLHQWLDWGKSRTFWGSSRAASTATS